MDLEDIGAGAIARAFRFFKNVANFRELSLFGKLRTLAVPAALLGVPATGIAPQTAVMGKLSPTQVQAQIVETCLSNIKAAPDYKFSGIVTNKMGCACTAKIVSAAVPDYHLKDFGAAQKLAFEGYNIQTSGETEDAHMADFQRQLSDIIKEANYVTSISSASLANLVETTLAADMTCNEAGMYFGDNLKQIASLKPFAEPIWTDDSRGTVEVKLRGSERPILMGANE